MKIYEVIYIIYVSFIVIIITAFIYVIFREYADNEDVPWKVAITVIMIPFGICTFLIYYIVLIDGYCDQVKIKKETIEGTRNLEAKVSNTN